MRKRANSPSFLAYLVILVDNAILATPRPVRHRSQKYLCIHSDTTTSLAAHHTATTSAIVKSIDCIYIPLLLVILSTFASILKNNDRIYISLLLVIRPTFCNAILYSIRKITR